MSPVTVQPSRRRPSVVVNHFPDRERNLRQPSRIVPGFQKYSKAHIRNTLIVTDSMTSRIRAKDIKQNINLNEENVIMKKFPGGTSEEVAYYAKYNIEKIRPSQVIAVAGTNDIAYDSKDGVPDERKIVNNLIGIGKFAKEHGVNDVYIYLVLLLEGVENMRMPLKG